MWCLLWLLCADHKIRSVSQQTSLFGSATRHPSPPAGKAPAEAATPRRHPSRRLSPGPSATRLDRGFGLSGIRAPPSCRLNQILGLSVSAGPGVKSGFFRVCLLQHARFFSNLGRVRGFGVSELKGFIEAEGSMQLCRARSGTFGGLDAAACEHFKHTNLMIGLFGLDSMSRTILQMLTS